MFPAMYGGLAADFLQAKDISPETNDPAPDIGRVMLEIAVMKSQLKELLQRYYGEKQMNLEDLIKQGENIVPETNVSRETLEHKLNELRLQIEDLKTRVEQLQNKG
ncbi:MAG TPA: hypothetical protein PLK61_04100 [Nitrosomonas sp.]|nr:hypothetical protein [Nitrosomonas sp.]